jgi:hypothetical protein
LGVLRQALPARGKVLEIASGTGEHAVYFARQLPHLTWQPTDVTPEALMSIEAHRAEAELDNLLAPAILDVRDDDWGEAAADAAAMVCVNMIHISPWSCCEGLLRGASRVLAFGGPLVLYGPFRFEGKFTAPSNAAFDASLRASDPSWGVRDLRDVTASARTHGLVRDRVVALPANNHAVVFRKS